jgi:2-amino-4-hydroxy-6-hydroxymethyldihydropteridine diphosphokinase
MTQAAIALGANLGCPERTFRNCLARLAEREAVRLRAVSRFYESEPWGLREQPPFLNAVALLATDLSAPRLLEILAEEERRAGRRPGGPRWGPRPLDLDLLWYGEMVSHSPELRLPHPGIPERSFVLLPLAEVAPHWRHPVLGRTAREMLRELARSGGMSACRPLRAGRRPRHPSTRRSACPR